MAEDPKQEKNRMSRKRPRTREIIVNPLTTERLLASLLIANQQAILSISTTETSGTAKWRRRLKTKLVPKPPTPVPDIRSRGIALLLQDLRDFVLEPS